MFVAAHEVPRLAAHEGGCSYQVARVSGAPAAREKDT